MTEQIKNMLDLMLRPAFCEEGGVVAHVNPAARLCRVEPGMELDALLGGNRQEYKSFCGGCLYLTLQVEGEALSAQVVQVDGENIFLLEDPESGAQLRSLALAAKELREPLAGVVTVADRLLPKVAEDDKSQAQAAQMNRRLFQMMRMISNMSDAFRYAQPDAGRMEYVQAVSLFEEIFQRAAELLKSAGLTVEYTLPAEPVYTLADPELLERAAYNLLSNAAKFAPKDGVIRVQLAHRGSRLYLTVCDDGPGIQSDVRGNLYNRFLREPALEDLRNGIGLGLVLVRTAAALHEGAVLIDQKDGKGNRTTMTMAVRQSKKTVLRSPALRIDYAGEWDHGLLELSDCLPAELYRMQ